METLDWKAFEAEWTNAILDSVTYLRERADITVKQLGARLRLVGWQVSDATLSGILSGRKRTSISVAEMFAFARALDVTPTFLLLGLPKLANLPSNEALWGDDPSIVRVAAWVRGYAQPPILGDNDEATLLSGDAVMAVMAYANHERAAKWQAARIAAGSELSSEDRSILRLASTSDRKWLASVVESLAELHLAQPRLSDMAPYLPPMPDALAPALKQPVSAVVEALTIEQLAELAGDELMQLARAALKRELQEGRGKYDVAPTNPAK